MDDLISSKEFFSGRNISVEELSDDIVEEINNALIGMEQYVNDIEKGKQL